MLEKKKNSGGYFWKTAKIAVITLIALISLSVTASACHIGNHVWNDLDMDGIQDSNEPGISGVTVNLYKCDGTYLKNTTTNSNGYYSFSLSGNRNYYVEFVLPTYFAFSPQDQGNDDCKDSDADGSTGTTICTYISSNENDRSWDAGIFEFASVGDFVWEDLNNNSVQDPNEPGMEGVSVELYSCTGQWIATAITDSTGSYEFIGLVPGDYYIIIQSPAGYVFVSPEQGGDPTVDSNADYQGIIPCFTLAAGEYNDMLDAGLFRNDQEIPEFPTVALPMVAIVGLAFVFGRKNE